MNQYSDIVARLLGNGNAPLVEGANIYDVYIRPFLLYAAETWTLTVDMEDIQKRCDYRILIFKARALQEFYTVQ